MYLPSSLIVWSLFVITDDEVSKILRMSLLGITLDLRGVGSIFALLRDFYFYDFIFFGGAS